MNSGQAKTTLPPIPDHALLRQIATGSYGSIWLAKNVLDTHRAVKVVQRRTFKSPRQYEREFEGVRHFEPISRSHPGFVHILQVGRNDQDGWFYYVMELADDADHGRTIRPETYTPRTIRSELDRRRRLPLDECLLLGQTLLLALEELHERGLVHRDLKPANLIYVDGVPKLADIGTVEKAGSNDAQVGSIGYNPPEGSGRPPGDVFSFGRVLYEMFSGVHVQELADALPDLRPRLKTERQHQLYDVIQRATHRDSRFRHPSARALREDLSALLPLSANEASPEASPSAGSVSDNKPAPADESAYSAVSPDSRLYVRRSADGELEAALSRREGVVFIMGEPQMGRTSLLARALHQARRTGARVAFTDLQKLNTGTFDSLADFYQALAESLADQLDLPMTLRRAWDPHRTPNTNLDRYLRREVLSGGFSPVVWGLDEIGRIQDWKFRDDFCGLLQAWCNERALEPVGCFGRLTLILTGPLGLQPCFGDQVALCEFSQEEVAELNRRCGSPLMAPEDLAQFHQLLNGHPFLCRYGLLELARHKNRSGLPWSRDSAWCDELFAEPLARVRSLLDGEPVLATAMRQFLTGSGSMDGNAFHRLRNAGLIMGDSPARAAIPCPLYEQHLRRTLVPARARQGA